MKKLLILFLTIMVTFNVYAGRRSQGIQITYSESADYFEIMENLINGDGDISKAYKNTLEKTFIVSNADRHWVAWYKKLRGKTSRKIKLNSEEANLFSDLNQHIDLISGAFLDSSRPLEALKKLQKKLNKKEFKALGKFYEHFNSKIAALVRLSSARQAEVSGLYRELKKSRFKNIITKASKFFALPKHMVRSIKMVFVWYPKSENMKVSYGKNFIIVRIHPEKSSELTKEKIMGILMNYLMRVQPSGSKQVISSKILDSCNPIKYFPAKDILEKTLSVAWGEMYYLNKLNRKNFELYKTWSKNPWVNTYAKLIYPLLEKTIKRKETIMSGRFLDSAVTTCDDLLALGKFI